MNERETLFSAVRNCLVPLRDHEAITALYSIEHQLEGLESVRRCNDPMPGGDGMQLCDLWPGHEGPHVHGETSTEWRNRG